MDIDWSSALKPEGALLDGVVPIALERPERLDVIDVSDVAVAGKAMAKGELMTVDATLSTTAVYRCVRCLSAFSDALSTMLHERFSQTPLSEEEEDAEVQFVSGQGVQLDAYVEQAIVLALRRHPVCREDCKGLCPVCGTDLNVKECDCQRQLIDPRLEALAQVLDEMNNDLDKE